MKGYVHSQESFGTVDGPGIRYVVFVQGCPMRCQYCHNPDTWTPAIGQMMDTDEILAAYERNRVYYQNGGLTVTGGEPLLSPSFSKKPKQRTSTPAWTPPASPFSRITRPGWKPLTA